jgi:hypothetical protein
MCGDLDIGCTFLCRSLGPSDANHTHRSPSQDRLYDPEKVIPARPTITNIQWISGTQYISPADMDLLST